MFIRVRKCSRWKLRIIVLFSASFLMFAVLSKLVFVAKDGRMPYVRVPAYLIAERKSDIPLGTPIYADSKVEDLYSPNRFRNLNGNVRRTINSSKYRNDVGLSGIQFRGKDGDIFQHSAGRIFNVFIWDEICGESLENLVHYPLFPYMPSRKRFSKTFHIMNYGQNFALWLVGYFTPLCDGYHTFELKIKSGNSEVWISTDSNKKNIRQVLSSVVKERSMVKELKLSKRQKYYFEVFHKEGNQDSMFNIEVSNSNILCKHPTQLLKFEPFKSPEQVWNIKTPAINLESELLPIFKGRDNSPKSKPQRSKRDEIFKIPFIDEADAVNLLPKCKYNPSYKVSYHLEKYDGVWETHFSSIYPSDDTNITEQLSSGERQIIFGNDIMEKSIAMRVVYGIMGIIKQRFPG